jgi:protein associated with RNAse G/E
VSDVRIVYRKYGGALHWNYPATLLGEDEHGIWVATPAGTVARKGEGSPVTWDLDAITLFPRDAWWTASFNAPPHRAELYVDVTTIPEWRDDEVTMLDLDLDVIRMRDGRLILDDEDEFVEHQVLLSYPSELIAQAERSARWLLDAVKERREPFGSVQAHWMAQIP